MKKIKITKKEIIKALKTEPLKSGIWIDYSEGVNYNDKVKKAGKCGVCAVGAVLRSKLKEKTLSDFEDICNIATKGVTFPDIYSYGNIDLDEEVNQALSEENYMGALTLSFEGYAKQFKTMPPVRKRMIKFVQENFPNEIKVAV